MNKHLWIGLISLCVVSASAQTMIESFEYGSDDDLLAAWMPSGNATPTLSDSVATKAAGKKSMKVDFNFPSTTWATETIRGPMLDTPVSIGATQYVTLRLRGDPAFATSDFRTLYLYVYDADGNFGRWGTDVPLTDDWQVFNFLASSIQAPWDSPALPDLSRIVQFAFFQYGSQAAIPAYTATIYIDDVMVRDTPLTEFPAPSAPRSLIDDFEAYANDAALRSFYTYETSPAATETVASLDSTAPQGAKALKLAINFAPGQYPWGSVRSALVAPFSLPTNALISLRLKGDEILAPVADDGTTFWISFYDKAGNAAVYRTASAPVISSTWTTLQARLQDLGDTSTVDLGNLVQWRILIQGWTGIAEQPGLSAIFYVDDIHIGIAPDQAPSLSMIRDGAGLQVGCGGLAAGTSYTLQVSPDLIQWSTAATIDATQATKTWPVPEMQSKAFYRLMQNTAQ